MGILQTINKLYFIHLAINSFDIMTALNGENVLHSAYQEVPELILT